MKEVSKPVGTTSTKTARHPDPANKFHRESRFHTLLGVRSPIDQTTADKATQTKFRNGKRNLKTKNIINLEAQ